VFIDRAAAVTVVAEGAFVPLERFLVAPPLSVATVQSSSIASESEPVPELRVDDLPLFPNRDLGELSNKTT